MLRKDWQTGQQGVGISSMSSSTSGPVMNGHVGGTFPPLRARSTAPPVLPWAARSVYGRSAYLRPSAKVPSRRIFSGGLVLAPGEREE